MKTHWQLELFYYNTTRQWLEAEVDLKEIVRGGGVFRKHKSAHGHVAGFNVEFVCLDADLVQCCHDGKRTSKMSIVLSQRE